MQIEVRPPRIDEYEPWAALYRGYREFYRMQPDETVLHVVWSWIHDPDHEVRALVADSGDALRGLAHFRRFARPSEGGTAMYLDDLFTDPDHRGGGVGRALIEAVAAVAAGEGCQVLRWITGQDNATAQRLYDTLAKRTSWLTYDMPIG
jgi:GNAT superfamily N-acetyltransferase